MADMNRYFDLNAENPSAHWFSAGSVQNPICSPSRSSYFVEDGAVDSLHDDPEYRKKMTEFENTIQEKLREEMRDEEILFVRKWTNAGLQIVALITDHLISHPFIVLRRQCQVNHELSRHHIIPVTLIPVVLNIHRWQGITCLWKGVGSLLVVRGLTLAVQDLVSKFTVWPKEVSPESSSVYIGKHILLKFVTYAFITPFYSASLLETVQSEIASEKPEFLDVFKEGFRRLIAFNVPQKGRMLPVWSLVVPTAAYFILKHFFTLFVKTVISKMMILNQDFQHRKQGAIPKDLDFKDNENIELTSSLIAVLSADIVLYPLETVLHRLHLQGTRTIIDNLDDGLSVTPILTNFEGVVDCYDTTLREEGTGGLYKGFGALIMQCIAYTSIIKLSKFVFTQISILCCKNDSGYLIRNQFKDEPSHFDDVQSRKITPIVRKPKHDYISSDSDSNE